MLADGRGRVAVTPRANSYSIGQSITLTTVPDSGQSFVDWSGDATGTRNPFAVSMTQSKVITANFTLLANRLGLEGLSADGFRLTVVSDPQTSYQIFGSTNLTLCELPGTVTNPFGEVQFTDPDAAKLPSRFYQAGP